MTDTSIVMDRGVASPGVQIPVKGKTWVLNIDWDSVTSVKVAKRNVANLQKNPRWKKIHYGYRGTTGPAQTGYVQLAQPKKRLFAAAAAVADNYPSGMIALLPLPGGGFWVVAVRDNDVIAGGDRVFRDDEDELALQAFNDLVSRDEDKFGDRRAEIGLGKDFLNHRSVPESGVALTFLEIVSGKEGMRLGLMAKQFLTPRQTQAVLLAIVIVGGGLTANYFLSKKPIVQQVAVNIPEYQVLRPWEGKMLPSQMANACVNLLLKMPLEVPGWKNGPFVCAADQSLDIGGTVSFTRNVNSTSSLRFAESMVKGLGTFKENPGSAGSGFSITSVTKGAGLKKVSGEPSLRFDNLVSRLRRDGQDLQIAQMDFSKLAVAVSMPNFRESIPDLLLPPLYPSRISIRTFMNPVDVARMILDSYDSLWIESLLYEFSSKRWTITSVAFDASFFEAHKNAYDVMVCKKYRPGTTC
jgi:hypothetical protein